MAEFDLWTFLGEGLGIKMEKFEKFSFCTMPQYKILNKKF
jgi:hypothetical protein